MKFSMLYSIMQALGRHGRMRREELAKEFDISPRTVQRAIEELTEAGVPIVALSGKNGGYTIAGGVNAGEFSEEDIARLRDCLDALSQTFKDDLTEELARKLAGIADNRLNYAPRLVIDSDGWGANAQSAKLDAVSAAIAGYRTVDIYYTDKTGKSGSRLLDPYTLALKEGVWYVYGWCHTHNEFRIFRLARIKSVELTDKTFTHRAGADVRAALSVDLGGRLQLELEADESALARLEEWLGAGSVTRTERGYICKADVGGGAELIRRIVAFGSSVKVISPSEVAERTLAEARKIAALYEQKPTLSD